MKVFGDYAAYYNLLYKDKNYAEETDYIFGLINKFNPKTKDILELGCGTGKHADLLSKKGLNVHGIDISEEMLCQARNFTKEGVSFDIGDVRKYRINKKFDLVLSLFHVASYQVTNQDLKEYFETAATHLNQGGVFIFDVWYGPAVLNQKPENRTKNLEDEVIKITRNATPVINYNQNTVDVNYDIIVFDKATKTENKLKETHKMRYLFKPELELMLNHSGFNLIHGEEWLSGREIGPDSWGSCFVGVKK